METINIVKDERGFSRHESKQDKRRIVIKETAQRAYTNSSAQQATQVTMSKTHDGKIELSFHTDTFHDKKTVAGGGSVTLDADTIEAIKKFL